jgi:4-amino-4-deoxy-L-arabinose transferase-like glycosyltransferase
MKYLLVIMVLTFSLFLRLKNNAFIPLPGESIDEYSNTWVGMSLLKFGIPIGISSDLNGYTSSIKAYVNVDQIYQTRGGDSLTIRKNWFDHPPLSGIITALYTRLRGGSVFEDATTRNIRKPLIIVGVITTLCVFLIGLEIYNYQIALLASVLYSISPTILFGSRPVQSENFLIPTILLSLYFLIKYLNNNKSLFIIISGILFGISTLFKLSSIFFLPVVLILILSKKNKASLIGIGYFLVSFLPISLLFITYGAAISLPDFINILFGNTQRGFEIGPDLFDTLLLQTKIGFRTVPDLWVLLSWFAAIVTISKINKKSKGFPLSIYFICYLIFFIILGGNGYSWYFLPFYPITFIFMSKLVYKLLRQPQKYIIIYIFSMAIIGVYFRRIMGQPSPQYINPMWRYISILTIVPYVLSYIIVNNKLLNKGVRTLTYLLFATAIIISYIYIHNMSPEAWFQIY